MSLAANNSQRHAAGEMGCRIQVCAVALIAIAMADGCV
jgi:hypothetical protein